MAIVSKAKPRNEKLAGAYPKLMISKGLGEIVLMSSDRTGTVVHAGNSTYDFWHYSESWNMSFFTEYDGKVVIGNKS